MGKQRKAGTFRDITDLGTFLQEQFPDSAVTLATMTNKDNTSAHPRFVSRPSDAQGRFQLISPLPSPNKSVFTLKQQFKKNKIGVVTQQASDLKQIQSAIENARNKINNNALQGDSYSNDDATVKLHVSINDILDLDAHIIQEFIQFMLQQSEKLDASFKFKIVQPKIIHGLNERFEKNDQITIYFDKYSSIADVIQLGRNIEAFLKSKNLPDNQYPLGPKDSFGINSFVSVRTDSNKLLAQYGEYKFFDLEIKKFYERYKDNLPALKNVPMAAFDTIFNSILIDITIIDLNQGELSAKSSEIVQQRFDLLVKDPQKYLANTIALVCDSEPAPKVEEIQKMLQKRIDAGEIKTNFKLEAFELAVKELALKGQELIDRGYPQEGKETKDLATALTYLHKAGYSKENFQTRAQLLLEKGQNSSLANFRGVLGAIAKLLYLVSFSKIDLTRGQTDTVKQLKTLQGTIGFFAPKANNTGEANSNEDDKIIKP